MFPRRAEMKLTYYRKSKISTTGRKRTIDETDDDNDDDDETEEGKESKDNDGMMMTRTRAIQDK
jgi:hypothetical protein